MDVINLRGTSIFIFLLKVRSILEPANPHSNPHRKKREREILRGGGGGEIHEGDKNVVGNSDTLYFVIS